MDGKSLQILTEKLNKLKQIIPDAFADGKVDWEKLKAALGDDINFENERYNLNWAGKSDVFRVLQERTSATLRPVKEESVNFDETENVFIEGENLEVLKVLQKSYFGKIKMIYIDPPYNTGNDSFIYPDKFSESKEEYLKRIGHKSEEGYLLKEGFFRKNSKDGGHYHSNWLSMMYPRLYIARNLLRDDGVIFVSIDDNEVHNIRMVMNEIFGEENFLAQLVWDLGSGTAAGHFTRAHEYILVFAKEKNSLKNFSYTGESDIISERAVKKISKGNPASKITFPPGIDFEGIDAEFGDLIGKSEKIKVVSGKLEFKAGKLLYEVTLEAGWAMRDQILSWLSGEITYDSKGQKVLRFYFSKKGVLQYEKERGFINPPSVLRKIASTKKGTEEIEEIFGANIMEFPKPSPLLKYLYSVVTNNDDIIIDFFAGSGTTAQAVLELNKEDGGKRKFVLVQLAEKTDEKSEAFKAGYKTIADICKERISKVIQKINNEINDTQKELDSIEELILKSEAELSRIKKQKPELFTNQKPSTEVQKIIDEIDRLNQKQNEKSLQLEKLTNCDKGFKSFTLSSSNFKHWRSDIIESEEDLNKMVELFNTQLKPEAKELNLLFELMLKSGYTLTDKIEHKDGFYFVANKLAVVLNKIDQSIIDKILTDKSQNCILLDNLFAENDQLKTNTALQMKDASVEMVVV